MRSWAKSWLFQAYGVDDRDFVDKFDNIFGQIQTTSGTGEFLDAGDQVLDYIIAWLSSADDRGFSS